MCTEQFIFDQKFTVAVKNFRQIDLGIDHTASGEFFRKFKILFCFFFFAAILIKNSKIICPDSVAAFYQFLKDFFCFIITTEHLIHFSVSIFDTQIVPTGRIILNNSSNQSGIGDIRRIGECLNSNRFAVFVKEKLIITQHPSAAGIGMDAEVEIISQIPNDIVIVKILWHIRIHKWFYQSLGFLFGTAFETGFIQAFGQF